MRTLVFKRPQEEAVLPEEDTSSSLGWKLFRMDTSHAHTLNHRDSKVKGQTSQSGHHKQEVGLTTSSGPQRAPGRRWVSV